MRTREKSKIVLLAFCALITSCATCVANIEARTYLAKCKYELAGLSVVAVELSSVDFEAKVKITNPTDRDVALDHADLSFFLDQNHVLDVTHPNFVRIPTKSASTEAIEVKLPVWDVVKALGHRPQTFSIRGKLWLAVLVGRDTWVTPIAVPIETKVTFPWDQIGVPSENGFRPR